MPKPSQSFFTVETVTLLFRLLIMLFTVDCVTPLIKQSLLIEMLPCSAHKSNIRCRTASPTVTKATLYPGGQHRHRGKTPMGGLFQGRQGDAGARRLRGVPPGRPFPHGRAPAPLHPKAEKRRRAGLGQPPPKAGADASGLSRGASGASQASAQQRGGPRCCCSRRPPQKGRCPAPCYHRAGAHRPPPKKRFAQRPARAARCKGKGETAKAAGFADGF